MLLASLRPSLCLHVWLKHQSLVQLVMDRWAGGVSLKYRACYKRSIQQLIQNRAVGPEPLKYQIRLEDQVLQKYT